MVQCVAKPGVTVVIDPGIKVSPFGNDGSIRCYYLEPVKPRVIVRGPMRDVSRNVIVSHDRFCAFVESDLDWALPLGFCHIEQAPFEHGDKAKLSQFCDIEQNLVCVEPATLFMDQFCPMVEVVFKPVLTIGYLNGVLP